MISADLLFWSIVARRVLRPIRGQSAIDVHLVSWAHDRVPLGPNEFRTVAAAEKEGVRLVKLLACETACEHATCRFAREYIASKEAS